MCSLVINESMFGLFSAAGQGNPSYGSAHTQSKGNLGASLGLFMPLRSVFNKDDGLFVWGGFVDIVWEHNG